MAYKPPTYQGTAPGYGESRRAEILRNQIAKREFDAENPKGSGGGGYKNREQREHELLMQQQKAQTDYQQALDVALASRNPADAPKKERMEFRVVKGPDGVTERVAVFDPFTGKEIGGGAVSGQASADFLDGLTPPTSVPGPGPTSAALTTPVTLRETGRGMSAAGRVAQVTPFGNLAYQLATKGAPMAEKGLEWLRSLPQEPPVAERASELMGPRFPAYGLNPVTPQTPASPTPGPTSSLSGPFPTPYTPGIPGGTNTAQLMGRRYSKRTPTTGSRFRQSYFG